jgi:hypothetical protein
MPDQLAAMPVTQTLGWPASCVGLKGCSSGMGCTPKRDGEFKDSVKEHIARETLGEEVVYRQRPGKWARESSCCMFSPEWCPGDEDDDKCQMVTVDAHRVLEEAVVDVVLPDAHTGSPSHAVAAGYLHDSVVEDEFQGFQEVTPSKHKLGFFFASSPFGVRASGNSPMALMMPCNQGDTGEIPSGDDAVNQCGTEDSPAHHEKHDEKHYEKHYDIRTPQRISPLSQAFSASPALPEADVETPLRFNASKEPHTWSFLQKRVFFEDASTPSTMDGSVGSYPDQMMATGTLHSMSVRREL